jgi:hypothetical protein
MQGYAYDLALLITGKFSNTVSEIMQGSLNKAQTWCRAKEISISPNKNKLVLFTMKKKVEGLAEPTLLNIVLHTTRFVKYPGVILDVKLTGGSRMSKSYSSFLLCCRTLGYDLGS